MATSTKPPGKGKPASGVAATNVPSVRQTSPTVIGLAVGDLHFSEKAPVARSVETDWLSVQEGYVKQLRAAQEEFKVPILIPGDIFHKWNSSPLLINYVIRWFQGMDIYAIPGNHDMPHHNYLQLEKSAYWTLVEAGVIKHLMPGAAQMIGGMDVSAFPHSFEVKSTGRKTGIVASVALIHAFIWTKATAYPGADINSNWSAWTKKLGDYDIAIFGDNHKGFLTTRQNDLAIANCGTFIRRNTDEREYQPYIVKIMSDWTVNRIMLNTEHDQFADLDEIESGLGAALQDKLDDFSASLADLHSEQVSYAKKVQLYLEQVQAPDVVRDYMLRAVGEKK